MTTTNVQIMTTNISIMVNIVTPRDNYTNKQINKQINKMFKLWHVLS